MEGLRSVPPTDFPGAASSAPYSAPTSGSRISVSDGLVYRVDVVETVIVSKFSAGFTPGWVEPARRIVRDAAAGRLGRLKFLAFDFAHSADQEATGGGEEVRALVGEVANLILEAPVVSIAYVREHIGGADLELALACSMLVCEEGAKFSFAADPVVSVATYALLAQKIGFVRAERLMEREEVLDAAQMRDLLLLKETTEAQSGLNGLERFLHRQARRHNSAYGIYRAQRIATPLIPEAFAPSPIAG